MKYITLIMLFFSTFSFSEKKEIICELEGSFSVTYRDLSKTVISEGLDFFKNLATQTQQSIFLINKAKTNFDKEDWQKIKDIEKKDEDKKLVQIKTKLEKLLSVKEKIDRLQSKAQSISIENLSRIKEEIKQLKKNIKIS